MFGSHRSGTLLLMLGLVLAAAAVNSRIGAAPLIPGEEELPGTPALPAHYALALSFDEFLASDTAADERWPTYYAQAAAAVAPHLTPVRDLPGQWHLLVVAENWCGDAANSVPYLARLAAESPNLDLRLLRKAEAEDLLQAHAVDGGGRIPLAIVLDEQLTERGVWIERPAELRALVAQLQAWDDLEAEDIRAQVRAWYAADGGRTALAEVVALLEETGKEAARVAVSPAELATPQCSAP